MLKGPDCVKVRLLRLCYSYQHNQLVQLGCCEALRLCRCNLLAFGRGLLPAQTPSFSALVLCFLQCAGANCRALLSETDS